MNVEDKLVIDNFHSIEWGAATWDEDDFSIRNRFDGEAGRFNKASSSEIPWTDFNQMIIESIRRNHFTNDEIANITRAIADNISQRS